MSHHRTELLPVLNLAPKLKRPLSLWNPLDYLRLLYWVFYFPQALRWYVARFGGEFIQPDDMNWRTGLDLFRQNRIQQQLLLQGVLLTICISIITCSTLQQVGVSIDWFGMARGLAVGMFLGLAGGVFFGVAFGVFFGVAFGAAFGVAFGAAFGVAFGVAGSLIGGMAFGMAFGMAIGVAIGVASGVAVSVTFGLASGVLFSVAFGVIGGVFLGLAGGVAFGVTFGMAFSMVILHPEGWLVSSFLAMLKPHSRQSSLVAVTPVPISWVAKHLRHQLKTHWEAGIHDANELLSYSLQFIPVVHTLKQVLAEISDEQLIYRVAQLAESPFDWNVIRYASASISERLKSRAIDGFLSFPLFSFLPFLKPQFQQRLNLDCRLDTFARAAAAGFWYLYAEKPDKATDAFAVVRSILYGEEMLTLSQTLAVCSSAETIGDLLDLQLPAIPQKPLLRSKTWQAIARYHRIIDDTQMVQRSVSRSAKAFALNRALGELKAVLDQSKSLPEAERGLIIQIAETWRDALLSIATEVGEIEITKPVRNCYVIGDPVEGNLFVGRDDIIRQLEELWVLGNQLQSVVLYGHRRMGKTSILKNITRSLGAGIKVAYVNLLLSSTVQNVGDWLIAVCDEISQVTAIEAPSDDEILNAPYRNFERYLRQVEASLNNQGLIIAIDEFEKIEELIESGRISADLMGYLRGLVQMSPKVAFAFAGLHTLDEMTEDYFHPFFASISPIHIGFLSFGSVQQLLANPTSDFPFDYDSDAYEQIWSLAAGQPFLTQLIGFQLVRRYNAQVFEQGQTRNPIFTVDDVQAVVNDPDFFNGGRYYFTGIWNQAEQDPTEQQPVLKVIAPHLSGLTIDEIVEATGLTPANVTAALRTLKRHDVVQLSEGKWQIVVELFRRWVVNHC